MMITAIAVVAALLIGACTWHLLRRFKSRG